MNFDTEIKEVPYDKLADICDDLAEANAGMAYRIDRVTDEKERYEKLIDVLLELIVTLKGKSNLPF